MIEVLSVVSEVFPLIKTGGLADVAGALPKAVAALDVRMRTLVPGYPQVKAAARDGREAHVWPNLFGGRARLIEASAQGLDLFILDAPHLFDRSGNPYVGPDGRDWPDNAQRFAALARAGADAAQGKVFGYRPAAVHAHDWQAGLLPAYLHYDAAPHPPSLVTVHNFAFQGQFPATLLAALGLPPAAYVIDGVEYYGTIGYLKAALQFADRISTVSPTYAAEVMRPEAGMGLDGLMRARAADVVGILNGIDISVWDPHRDDHIATPFDAKHLAKRAKNKAALQDRMDLRVDPKAPVFGVVSRLTWQKGMDLLLAAAADLLKAGAQIAVLGAGDRPLEHAFDELAVRERGRVGCILAYDEGIAHEIHAGSDCVLVPSRFEPCGLTQLCALRYGAVPVVARVGGLADSVVDADGRALAAGAATGFQFSPVDADGLRGAVGRAMALRRDAPAWEKLQRAGMKTDVSWRHSAQRYVEIYRELARAA